MLFRWFVGLNSDEEVWDATTFTKNRDRLLEADVAKESLAQVLAQALAKHGSQLNRPCNMSECWIRPQILRPPGSLRQYGQNHGIRH